MADLIAPKQQRTADPFNENRYSSTVNRLSRVITNGENIIIRPDKSFIIDVVDGETITVNPGIFIKDDILVHITSSYTIDMTDSTYYIDDDSAMIQEGYYYIVAQYSAARSLPSPKAYYRVIREDSLFDSIGNDYMYLANIYIRDIGEGDYQIDVARRTYYMHPDRDVKRNLPNKYALVVDGGELEEVVAPLTPPDLDDQVGILFYDQFNI